MKIVIYSKEDCIFCKKTVELLKEKQMDFLELKLNRDFDREEALMRFPDARTFPIITIDSEFIGGYNDLLRLSEEGKL
jgi:glutaredoxin